MKNFLILTVFIAAVASGVMLSSAASPGFISRNILHPNCVRWDEEMTKKPLFSLNEVNKLMGKKVISRNHDFHKGETGRVVHFEVVGRDKFLAVIYWGNGAEDDDSSLTFHDKQNFSKDFEVVN